MKSAAAQTWSTITCVFCFYLQRRAKVIRLVFRKGRSSLRYYVSNAKNHVILVLIIITILNINCISN